MPALTHPPPGRSPTPRTRFSRSSILSPCVILDAYAPSTPTCPTFGATFERPTVSQARRLSPSRRERSAEVERVPESVIPHCRDQDNPLRMREAVLELFDLGESRNGIVNT